jgi:hypothetical protein
MPTIAELNDQAERELFSRHLGALDALGDLGAEMTDAEKLLASGAQHSELTPDVKAQLKSSGLKTGLRSIKLPSLSQIEQGLSAGTGIAAQAASILGPKQPIPTSQTGTSSWPSWALPVAALGLVAAGAGIWYVTSGSSAVTNPDEE